MENRTDQAAQTLEQALAREILVSERLRLAILAAVMALVMVGWLIHMALFPGGTATLPASARAAMMALVGVGLLWELGIRALLGHFIRTGRQPPVYALYMPATSFYFVLIVMATLRLDFWLCAFTGAVAAVEYLGLAIIYTQAPEAAGQPFELTSVAPHLYKSLLFLVTGCVAGLVGLQIKRQVQHSFLSIEERNRVVNMFGQHVSPAVVDKLLSQDVELGGEVRHVCMMFLDIRDFTSFSERKRPEEVVEYLNGLFDFMIDSVNRHQGIVNKFLGDGFMAVFGAPISDGGDCQHAVAAAREIIAEVDARNATNEIPPTRIGIGLHAGEAVTGNVGSPQRKEYTIIGDVVNLASRIEQLNKQFSSRLLVSEAVLEAMGDGRSDAALLGPIEVKGHEAPVQVYRLA